LSQPAHAIVTARGTNMGLLQGEIARNTNIEEVPRMAGREERCHRRRFRKVSPALGRRVSGRAVLDCSGP
jgi:hypothetical protein